MSFLLDGNYSVFVHINSLKLKLSDYEKKWAFYSEVLWMIEIKTSQGSNVSYYILCMLSIHCIHC